MSYTKNILDKHLEIRYRGVFSFDDVYKTVRHWIDERRYDFMEGLYKDKVDTPFGNEVEIEMQPELKVTEFIKYHIYFTSKFTGVKEFTANINGEQKKVTDGRFWIRLNATVEFDYQDKFKSDFSNKILKFLVDSIFKNYYEMKHYVRLKKDLYDLHTKIKKCLNMETASTAY